jgi:hypothetical protein
MQLSLLARQNKVGGRGTRNVSHLENFDAHTSIRSRRSHAIQFLWTERAMIMPKINTERKFKSVQWH